MSEKESLGSEVGCVQRSGTHRIFTWLKQIVLIVRRLRAGPNHLQHQADVIPQPALKVGLLFFGSHRTISSFDEISDRRPFFLHRIWEPCRAGPTRVTTFCGKSDCFGAASG